MHHFFTSQAAAEYVGVVGRSAFQTFEATAGNAMNFMESHPVILVVLGVLAVLLFWATRPGKI